MALDQIIELGAIGLWPLKFKIITSKIYATAAVRRCCHLFYYAALLSRR